MFGVVSALTYTGANIALRAVADRGGFDWAVWVSCVKAVPAALAAWLLVAWRAGRGLPALPPRRLVVPLVVTGLVMQFVGNVSFQWSLSLGGLALTVPLSFASLILTGAVLGRIVLGEPIGARSSAAMAVLMLAIAVLSVGAEGATEALTRDATFWTIAVAVLSATAAGVAYGACGVVIRRTVTARVSLSAALVLLSTAGVVGLGALSLIRSGPAQLLATPADDFAIMIAAGTLNAVAFFAVSAALRHIPVTEVNLLNASQTAMCAIAGVLWFAEPPTVWLYAGVLLTMAGLVLLDNGRRLFDVERLRRETFVRHVEVHRQIGSTNDRALELAAAPQIETPLLVLAETQTGGRGRGANRWWTGPGALTFSLVLDAERLNLPSGRWPKLSLTAGLAVCEALAETVNGAAIGLKWPNDVYLGGRKLCGILVECPSAAAGRIVVGIGINVNNSLATAPSDLRLLATSLFDETLQRHDLNDVLVCVLARLEAELAHLAAADADLSHRWRAYCMLQDLPLSIAGPAERISGICRGIDRDGALLLETAAGITRVFSGVVTRLDPPVYSPV